MLYFTIGLPRSGKTTKCKKWEKGMLKIHNNKFYSLPGQDIARQKSRVVVSPDEWRKAMGHRYNWHVEPVVFSHVQIAAKALLHNYDVIIDCTNTTLQSVEKWFQIDEEACPVLVDSDKNTCIQTAKESGQPDLEPIIERMANQLESGERYLMRVEELRQIIKRRVDKRKVII